MLPDSPQNNPQTSLFDIFSQLDQKHPLIQLSQAFPWTEIEETFAPLYSERGRAAKPIRLMSGLLILKSLYNQSDEVVIQQWQMNPYYQVFCGESSFQTSPPCHATELTKFRQRIDENGVQKLFSLSVQLHGDDAEESTVLVDTTVQEKAITYPTDSKLAIKIINRLNKLAKKHGLQQRRTFVKEVRSLRQSCRFFRHVKRRAKAKKALKRLRTIAGILLRELQRKLPTEILEQEAERFELYQRVLNQQPKDKNKIYSLHEPEVYCVGKGKDHKPYEYGCKSSVVMTEKSGVIVGAVSHREHTHDSKTLKPALEHAQSNRNKTIETVVVDRGYRGAKSTVDCEFIIPSAPLKKDTPYQRKRKQRLCRRRSAIEPVIGHLKADHRLSRNWLKGSQGDTINLLMAACAWNLKKWMDIWSIHFFVLKNRRTLTGCILVIGKFKQHDRISAILMAVNLQF